MNVNPFTFMIWVTVIMTVILLILLFILNYSKIMSFLFPHKWNYITMLEADNSITSWFQKKNKDLRFEFNDGYYNMYDSIPQTIELPNPDGTLSINQYTAKGLSSIYRNGRNAQFFYIEGNEDPLDFRANRITGNPQMRKQMLSMDLTKLWTVGSQLKNWILYALVGFLAGIIIGNIIGGWGKMPIPKPVETAQMLLVFWGGKYVRKH